MSQQKPLDGPGWALTLAELDDEAFVATLEAVFTALYRQVFAADELGINRGLPIEVRAVRHREAWRINLLLTPWMLARVFTPLRLPEIPIPSGWTSDERTEAPYQVIGPLIEFSVLDSPQKAHLNYQVRLGHYLIQPLVQSMARFASASAVFEAWSQVIATRTENMQKLNVQSRWQEDLSRRELFTRLLRPRHD
jgi:hypothetical protein